MSSVMTSTCRAGQIQLFKYSTKCRQFPKKLGYMQYECLFWRGREHIFIWYTSLDPVLCRCYVPLPTLLGYKLSCYYNFCGANWRIPALRGTLFLYIIVNALSSILVPRIKHDILKDLAYKRWTLMLYGGQLLWPFSAGALIELLNIIPVGAVCLLDYL
jgi:hypothetical protein